MACRQITQHALTFSVFAAELGDCLIGAPMRLVQEWRPQVGATRLKTRFCVAHGDQCVIDDAPAFLTGGIDHRLRAGFSLQQTL